MTASSSLFLLATLFLPLGAAWAGEPVPAEQVPGVRRVELSAAASRAIPEIAIGRGLATTVFFDSPIQPESVELEARDHFSRVSIAEDHLALIPSGAIRDGERFRLSVRFRGGTGPERAFFVLVMGAGEVDRQVEVFRASRSENSYQQESEELRDEVNRLRLDVERLQRACVPLGSSQAWFVSRLGRDSIHVTTLRFLPNEGKPPVEVMRARTAAIDGTYSLMIEVRGVAPGLEWMASGGSLVGRNGQSVWLGEFWQEAPLRTGQTTLVVVELDGMPSRRSGPYTLELWDREGRRRTRVEELYLE